MVESNNIVINNTEQIQMMNNKLALNIKKLDLPLPAVREGSGGEAEMGIQGTNLKKII